MKSIITIAFILQVCILWSNVHEIGADKTYKTPNELFLASENGSITILDNDSIIIDAGVYRGSDALAIWRANDLYIAGKDGKVKLYADGEYIIGKGIFVSAGNDITYEHLAFYNASVPDKNGAGIRLDGAGLVVRNCAFFNNENGILANNSEAGKVLIEYSEFSQGGFGDGFSHNIYINHCALLTIQFCYFHEARIGHQIKSRADATIIQYNRIADLTGNSSRLIDVPNGGVCIILGNELVQGENAENNNLIGFGLEGLINTGPHQLSIVHNTILNYRMASCVFFHVNGDVDSFLVANNILGGQCNLFSDKEAVMKSNLLSLDIKEIQFLDEINYNFGLFAGSPAIDHYVDLENLTLIPAFEYMHPIGKKIREIITIPDAGAHEGDIIIKTTELSFKYKFFPNPVNDYINLSNGQYEKYNIYRIDGKMILNGLILNNSIRVSNLEKGIYILSLDNIHTIKFIKQ